MTVLEELSNDIKFSSLRLELENNSDLKRLANLLRQNSSITDVDICVHDTFAEKPIKEITGFFEVLGTILNKLRKIELYPGEGNYNKFPIKALSSAVGHAHVLEILYIYHMELTAANNDFIIFAEWLECCPSMKEFCIIDCQLAEASTRSYSFDPIATVLSGMPALEVAALWARDNGYLGKLSSKALAALCCSSNMHRLMLLGFDISEKHAARMFEILGQNAALQRLNLSCILGAKGCASLSEMLEKNTTMEKLKIEVDALQTEDGCISITKGLERNRTLNYFRLSGLAEGYNKDPGAFADLLKRNYSLETLLIFDLWDPQMDFYLKLNQTGKRKLLRQPDASREKWVDALVSTRNDLECLFYFISMNPALCLDAL